MGKIDCLLEVTARFFKAGTKTDENLEDLCSFASYGRWDDAEGEEYWDFIEAEDIPATYDGMIRKYKIEDEDHYVILKDFVGFGFNLVFFGDFSGRRCSGVYAELQDGGMTLEDFFEGCQDALTEYALEERNAHMEKTKTFEAPLFPSTELLRLEKDEKTDPPDVIRFLLALEHVSNCYPSGPWGPEEYDSEINILGKVDASRLSEILI